MPALDHISTSKTTYMTVVEVVDQVEDTNILSKKNHSGMHSLHPYGIRAIEMRRQHKSKYTEVIIRNWSKMSSKSNF